jgi:bifunctional DNA primase/polymerase-like protein
MRPCVSVAGASRAEPGLQAAALAAAELGWHVFPCAPDSKRPALKDNWQDLATTDPDRIRCWWGRQPYNIGIACGPSGLVVIDLDAAHPSREGPSRDGTASLELLCHAHGQRYPAGTYTVDTPSGGCHLYFTAPAAPVRNSAGRAGPLIDIRADGGYVVGAGSRIGERAYAARGDFLPLTLPFPAWIARLLRGDPGPPLEGSATRGGERSIPPYPPHGATRAYALAALRAQTRRVADARPGTRNDTLNRAAFSLGQLVAARLLPPLPVMTALADAAACAGLPEDEARRTIRSGIAAGTRKPRT